MKKKFWNWEIAVLLNPISQSGLGLVWYMTRLFYILTIDLLIISITLSIGADFELDTDENVNDTKGL